MILLLLLLVPELVLVIFAPASALASSDAQMVGGGGGCIEQRLASCKIGLLPALSGPNWWRLWVWWRQISDVVRRQPGHLAPRPRPQHPGSAQPLPGRPEKQVRQESRLGKIIQENIRANAGNSGL